MGETLGDFVRDFEAKKQAQYGFMTASQLESGKLNLGLYFYTYIIITDKNTHIYSFIPLPMSLYSIFVANMGEKSGSRHLSKADRESKRKANSFKKDPLTQTKLQNFFTQIASNDVSTPASDESEDENTLIIDENPKNNHNDTTMKIDETNNETTIDGSTEDIKYKNENKATKSISKTFVINITLEGVSSKNSPKDSNIHQKDKKKGIQNENKDAVKESKSPSKIKPTAKRKIKALFGESSDSEVEEKKSEKHKTKVKHKHHKSSKEKKRKLSEASVDKVIKSENKSVLKDSDVFGDLSNSGSEKELVIDDQMESQDNSYEMTKSTDNICNKNNISPQNEPDNGTSNDDSVNSSNGDGESPDIPDKEPKIADPTSAKTDDTKLFKAHKLSIEADKVLMELKQFSEMPPEPPPVESIVPEVIQPTKDNEPKSPTIKEKLKDKHADKHKDKHRHRHKSSSNKEHKKKHMEKPKKEENKNEKEKKDSEKHPEKISTHVKEPKKSEKVDVAGLVVKLLMPYYKKKKISSRDLFKITARHIVHQLLAIQVTGEFFFIRFHLYIFYMFYCNFDNIFLFSEEAAINMLLKKTFSKEVKIEKESDLPVQIDLSKIV